MSEIVVRDIQDVYKRQPFLIHHTGGENLCQGKRGRIGAENPPKLPMEEIPWKPAGKKRPFTEKGWKRAAKYATVRDDPRGEGIC